MDYGAKNIEDLIPSEEDPIVKCTNCETYHYESLGGTMDTYNLQLLYDEDDPDEEHPYKGCGNCQTDANLMDIDQPEVKKKPKVMIVGHVDHGRTTMIARAIAAMPDHDVEMITIEQAREMGNLPMGELPMVLPFHAPPPIPILEEPLTLIPRKDFLYDHKSGRQDRNERRKKNKKKKRRY
ncbi:MAG: hypothetical protein WD512_13505 [Candidatus Paceibacterota bacterium]